MPISRSGKNSDYEQLIPNSSQYTSHAGRWRWRRRIAAKAKYPVASQFSPQPSKTGSKALSSFASVRGYSKHKHNQGFVPEKAIRESLDKQVRHVYGQSLKSLPIYEQHALRDHMLQALDWSRSQSLSVTLQDCAEEAVLNCPSKAAQLSPSTFGALGIKNTVYKLEEALGHSVKSEYQKASRDYARFTSRSAALLSRSPYEEAARGQNYQQQADELKFHLAQLGRTRLASIWELSDQGVDRALKMPMVNDLQLQLGQLKEKIAQLETLHREDFRHESNWFRSTQARLDTGIQLAKQKRAALFERNVILSAKEKKQAKHFLKVQSSLVKERKALLAGEVSPASRKTMNQLLRKEEEKLIKKMAPSIFERKAISKEFNRIKAGLMNDRSWEEINKTLPFEHVNNDGVRQYVELKSVITPAGAMRFRENKYTAGGRSPFQNDISGHGTSSMARNAAGNAVNLATTKLKDPDGNTHFAGVRSGVMCAFGIKNEVERKQANLCRANDVLTAALMQQIERHPEIAWQDGEVVNLKLFSNPLLTPDKARHATGIHDDELTFLREQREAIQQAAAAKEITVYGADGKEHKVNINVDLLSCNIGVNNLAFGAKGRLAGAWKAAKEDNKVALAQLMGSVDVGGNEGGWVADWLQENKQHPDAPVVHQLVDQIRKIWNSKSYREDGGDAFKLASRLAFLTWKIGAIPHWNCKSGKDRTGEADAAIKRLVAETELRGYVPDPDLPLTRTEQINAQAAIAQSGQIELIAKNIAQSYSRAATGMTTFGKDVYKMVH